MRMRSEANRSLACQRSILQQQSASHPSSTHVSSNLSSTQTCHRDPTDNHPLRASHVQLIHRLFRETHTHHLLLHVRPDSLFARAQNLATRGEAPLPDMVSTAGGIVIAIIVIALAAAVAWVVFTQLRARRLGVCSTPPSPKPIDTQLHAIYANHLMRARNSSLPRPSLPTYPGNPTAIPTVRHVLRPVASSVGSTIRSASLGTETTVPLPGPTRHPFTAHPVPDVAASDLSIRMRRGIRVSVPKLMGTGLTTSKSWAASDVGRSMLAQAAIR